MKSPVKYLNDEQYSGLLDAERWLHVFRSLVGTHEDWGPNRSARIDAIESHWGLKGEPYCIMAVGHCLILSGANFEKFPKGWPLVANAVNWAKQNGCWHESPARGRIGCYVKSSGKGHAMACLTGELRNGFFRTIQANTGAAGDSRDGDGIYEKSVNLHGQFSQYPVHGFISVEKLF